MSVERCDDCGHVTEWCTCPERVREREHAVETVQQPPSKQSSPTPEVGQRHLTPAAKQALAEARRLLAERNRK